MTNQVQVKDNTFSIAEGETSLKVKEVKVIETIDIKLNGSSLQQQVCIAISNDIADYQIKMARHFDKTHKEHKEQPADKLLEAVEALGYLTRLLDQFTCCNATQIKGEVVQYCTVIDKTLLTVLIRVLSHSVNAEKRPQLTELFNGLFERSLNLLVINE